MQKTAFSPRRSRASFILQNPMRIPYSAHAQLGTSGTNETPCGGVSIVRGKGASGSQTSTVTSGHTATVFSFGRRNGMRSTMALYSTLSQSFISLSSDEGFMITKSHVRKGEQRCGGPACIQRESRDERR